MMSFFVAVYFPSDCFILRLCEFFQQASFFYVVSDMKASADIVDCTHWSLAPSRNKFPFWLWCRFLLGLCLFFSIASFPEMFRLWHSGLKYLERVYRLSDMWPESELTFECNIFLANAFCLLEKNSLWWRKLWFCNCNVDFPVCNR